MLGGGGVAGSVTWAGWVMRAWMSWELARICPSERAVWVTSTLGASA
jgi:hypothetical protein